MTLNKISRFTTEIAEGTSNLYLPVLLHVNCHSISPTRAHNEQINFNE